MLYYTELTYPTWPRRSGGSRGNLLSDIHFHATPTDIKHHTSPTRRKGGQHCASWAILPGPSASVSYVYVVGWLRRSAQPGRVSIRSLPAFPCCNDTSVAAGPFPFMTQCLDGCIAFGVPTKRDFDGVSVHQPAETDLSASFSEHRAERANHRALHWVGTASLPAATADATARTSYP